jgi:2,3-bisphosphoglycerate-independent phosphoglycerate mutase
VVARGIVIVLDGASEPLDGARRTSLEQARTPALDALARAGELRRVRTVPPGLPAGSEVAIPVLLGWTPGAAVDRGAIEAAAHGIDVPAGARAWRVDVVDVIGGGGAGRAGVDATARAERALRTGAPGHVVHRLTGHRLLLVGASPLPAAARAPHLRAWPEGIAVPRTLDARTVVVAARGAGAGVGALLGARVVIPGGATGDVATDLHAKAAAAREALGAGADRVYVHVGGADEAAHARDARAKVAFLQRADRELVGPLTVAVARAGATLRICPDHGCDPATGRHDAAPVPCVTWTAGGAGTARVARRFTERDAAALPVTDLTTAATDPA